MCADAETLTAPELALIHEAFHAPNLTDGLNRFGMLDFASTDENRAAWTALARRIRNAVADEFVLCWRLALGRALKCVWYGGAPNAAIGQDLGVAAAQVSRWMNECGITIEALLLALQLTGRGGEPLPRPPAALVRRRAVSAGMGRFTQFFCQAGVFTEPGRTNPNPAQVELFLHVLARAEDWDRLQTAASAAPNRVAVFAPLAHETVSAALAALTTDGEEEAGTDEIGALLADPRRAVAECLRWRFDRTAYTTLRWTINALEDEAMLPDVNPQ